MHISETLCVSMSILRYDTQICSLPQLCMISNLVMDFIHATWNHLLSTSNQEWLSVKNLSNFADAV